MTFMEESSEESAQSEVCKCASQNTPCRQLKLKWDFFSSDAQKGVQKYVTGTLSLDVQGWIDFTCSLQHEEKSTDRPKNEFSQIPANSGSEYPSVCEKELKMKREWILQQDNDPAHALKSTMDEK